MSEDTKAVKKAQSVEISFTLNPYLYKTTSGADKEAFFNDLGGLDGNPDSKDRKAAVTKIEEGMNRNPVTIDWTGFTQEMVESCVKREIQRRINDRTCPKKKWDDPKNGAEYHEEARSLRHRWSKGEIEFLTVSDYFKPRVSKEQSVSELLGALKIQVAKATGEGDLEALQDLMKQIQTITETMKADEDK